VKNTPQILDALAQEQQAIAHLYERLDTLRERTAEQLRVTRLTRAGGNEAAQSERDAFAMAYEQRLAHLQAVEDSLCIGRIDLEDGNRTRIGRIGLSDDLQETMLVDWRAPAAVPFYQATAAHPQGVVRRLHLRTRGRLVLGVDDDVLDASGLSADERSSLSGEAALIASLQEHRTGRMRDVVATLQAEQDTVVRSDREGVLVVQGGPGTGKTVVALHRAAYLLYTHRERIGSSGVLVVGPSPVFLRYVEQVLPSLGETAVVLQSVGQLFPGVTATTAEPEAVAALKGDRRMVELMRRAVRERQQVPNRVDPDVGRRLLIEARGRAQASRLAHNPARNVFVRHVLTSIAQRKVGREVWADMDKGERDGELREQLHGPGVRATLDATWPHLSAPRLLGDLLSSRARLQRAGQDLLRKEELDLLHRSTFSGWTVADIALLDEVAELLGETDPWRDRRRRPAGDDHTYASSVLEAGVGRGLVSAEVLAERYAATESVATVAERATGDRDWVFGHVVVDEAQELSWMVWRVLMRRCPSRSMTVVGDIAQASTSYAAQRWSDVLDDHAPGVWRSVELTVGYRTPAEVMLVAADVLATIAPQLTAPQAVRSATRAPLALRAQDTVAGTVRTVAELVAADAGRIAVLAVLDQVAALEQALAGSLDVPVGPDAPVAVLTVAQSKGLEFDAVVLVDPQAMLLASPHGANDLYVGLTRTTDALVVVYPGDLPTVLGRLHGD
jgi:DNA helicase IV